MEALKVFGGAIHAWQEEGGVAQPRPAAASGTFTERASVGFQAYRRANLGLPPRAVAETRNALVRAIEEGRATIVAGAPGCRFIVEGAPTAATQCYVTMDSGKSPRDIGSVFGPFAI